MSYDSDDQKGGGIGEAIGAILAIPFGLFGCLLSAAIPGLVIFALVNGPGNTWRAIQQWVPGQGSEVGVAGNDECVQIRTWAMATDDRMRTHSTQTEEFRRKAQAGTLTDQDFETFIRKIEDLATAQSRSMPPPSVKQFNDLSVEMYEHTAAALRKRVAGSPGWSADLDAATAIYPTIEAGQREFSARCNIPLAPPLE